MKNVIKTELWKAFHNRMLYPALAVGAFIVAMNVGKNYTDVRYYTETTLWLLDIGYDFNAGSSGFSLFMYALPYNIIGFASRLFLYLWPLMAAIPYGWSYTQERRTGVFNQIVSRSGVRPYYMAKYIAVFCSGGTVVSLTVLVDLLANALVCPYWVLSPVDQVSFIGNGDFLSGLFYTYPWIHSFIWCGVVFLLGGVTACVCFFAWTRMRLRALVTIVPFVVYFVLNEVLMRTPLTANSQYVLSPMNMVSVGTGKLNPPWVILSIIGALLVVTAAVGYWQVVKHELD